MGIGKLLLVKCSQALGNWIKEIFIFLFLQIFVSIKPKDLFLFKDIFPKSIDEI